MIEKNDPRVLAYRAEKDPARRRRISDKLYRENQALVNRLVGKFAFWAGNGVEMEDLMQAGAIAFLYALDHIDISMTFSTYLAYRVWYEVSKCVEHGDVIYCPRGARMPLSKQREIDLFETRRGRRPSPEEVGVAARQMDKWTAMPRAVEQLAAGSGEGHDPPESRPDPEREMVLFEEHEELRAALGHLSAQQRRVVDRLFFREMEPRDVARELGMTLQAVNAVRADALAAMRGHFRGRDA